MGWKEIIENVNGGVEVMNASELRPRPAPEYRLVEEGTAATLSGRVTALMGEGWRLHQRPFVVAVPNIDEGGTLLLYCQAMIRGG